MSYILTMTFSGSMMLLLYMLVKHGVREKISAIWRYRMLKAAMIYFLLPLPFLKQVYDRWLDSMFPKETGIVYLWSNQSLIVSNGEELYINHVFADKLFWMGIWLVIAWGVMLLQVIKYWRNRKELFSCQKSWSERRNNEQWGQLKIVYGVRRKVNFYKCGMEQSAFTLGLFKPVILYADTGDDAENAFIISHELVHVRRCDMLWKVLMTLVKIVHWYNPVVWWLAKETEQVCEMSCDETVVRNKTEEERKQYAGLLLKASMVKQENSSWKVALSRNGKKVKERMDNVMKWGNETKRWSKYLSACVVGGAVLLNSLTVLAYDDVQYQTVNQESDNVAEQIEKMLVSDFVFVPDGMEKEEDIFTDIIEYDWQFVDADGNIYPVEEGINAAAACSHTYVSGEVKHHVKNADGSCSITYYEAKRCSKCGDVILGSYSRTAEFTVCKH